MSGVMFCTLKMKRTNNRIKAGEPEGLDSQHPETENIALQESLAVIKILC